MPGNAGDVIDEEKGARGGVDVRAVGIECLEQLVHCLGITLVCVPSVA